MVCILAQAIPISEKLKIAERSKAKGNALFKAGRLRFARARYDRLLRQLETPRDFETQEDVDRCVHGCR